MILPFKTEINGQENCFVDKIWNGLRRSEIATQDQLAEYALNYFRRFKEPWPLSVYAEQKIHTIRKDLPDFWKEGTKIHFYIHNRTKKAFQFAPIFEVKSVQRISIIKNGNQLPLIIYGSKALYPEDHFDYITSLDELAKNDGFANWEEFLTYFNEPFEGKIIHWTDFKY